VNDSVTKSKFDNLYGLRIASRCIKRHRCDGGGQIAVICGYGDVGKGSARCAAWRAWSSLTLSTLSKPRWRASGVTTAEDTPAAAIFTSPAPQPDILTFEHMQHMKDQAIVCNIGHFDNEIQVDRPHRGGR
jgi:adenosylhomocysteinase